MKKLFTTVLAAMMALSVWAEAPQTISYQAVVRNNVGRLHRDKPVGVRITILSGSEDGQVVYSETRTATTNNNGLLTFAIGDANAESSYDLSKIAWADNTYYLRCEMDPDGGNSYTLSSTSQMNSVPYALYAKNIAPEALPSWAQSEEKPVYNYTEIQGAPTVPTKVSELQNDANYITLQQVPTVVVPTKVSELQNDANYLTEHQSLADYAKKSELPAVPTKVSELTNDANYVTEGNITTTLNTINVSELVNDANYATTADVPTKVSQLTNDKGYITAADVPAVSVPTKVSELQNDANYLTEHQSLADYAKKSELPSTEGLLSAADAAATYQPKGEYLTEHQSLADYAKKSELPSVPTKVSELTNDAGYITEANVTTTLNTINVSELVNDANYATTADVPTKVSQLTNDKGYITAADVPAVSVPTKVSAFENDADYAKKSELPSVPTKVSELTNDANYVTEGNITTVLNTTNVSELVNDANYATTADVPTKVSQLTNDKGYITAADVPAVSVPTKVSSFENDANYITRAKFDIVLDSLNNVISSYETTFETLKAQITNPVLYNVLLNVSPAAGGYVSGAGSYYSGSRISLEAKASLGYEFSKWSDGEMAAKRTFEVASDTTVTAIFVKKPSVCVLSLYASPSQGGTVSGAGSYASGTSVTVKATPADGYMFGGWSDGNISASRTLVVGSDSTVTAKFAKKNQVCTINVVASPAAGGTVNGGGNYVAGSLCSIQPIPAEGYVFVAWSDGISTPERKFNVVEDVDLQAIFEIPASPITDGVLPFEFSVGSTKKVKFSQGNLQYQASTKTWRFAENQYDVIGAANKNISSTYTGWIDLFGWATSGYHDVNLTGNTSYQPYASSSTGYGPDADLAGNYAYYDWGVYNAILNGGNVKGLWRTLSKSEWTYLYSGRTNASSLRTRATVNGVSGFVFFPDGWEKSLIQRNGIVIVYNGGSFDDNKWTIKQWKVLEASGAVFLPCAGSRSGTTVSSVGTLGIYWSSTYSSRSAYYFNFNSSTVGLSDDYLRYLGHSVRLVQE